MSALGAHWGVVFASPFHLSLNRAIFLFLSTSRQMYQLISIQNEEADSKNKKEEH